MAPPIGALRFLVDLGMIVGPSVGYALQHIEIQQSLDPEAFSCLVVLVLVVSNSLRIVWWYRKQFEYTLLCSSVVVLFLQFMLLEVVCRLRRMTKSSNLKRCQSLQFIPLVDKHKQIFHQQQQSIVLQKAPLYPIPHIHSHQHHHLSADSNIARGHVVSEAPLCVGGGYIDNRRQRLQVLSSPDSSGSASASCGGAGNAREFVLDNQPAFTSIPDDPYNDGNSMRLVTVGVPLSPDVVESLTKNEDRRRRKEENIGSTTSSGGGGSRRQSLNQQQQQQQQQQFFSSLSRGSSVRRLSIGVGGLPGDVVDAVGMMQPTSKFVIAELTNWRLFWHWDYFASYGIVTSVWFVIWFAVAASVKSNVLQEIIGYTSLLTDAVLPLPQIVRMAQRRCTYGVSGSLLLCWLAGDLYKAIYFFFVSPDVPIQFKICGVLHLAQDALIIFLFLVLPNVPPAISSSTPVSSHRRNHGLSSAASLDIPPSTPPTDMHTPINNNTTPTTACCSEQQQQDEAQEDFSPPGAFPTRHINRPARCGSHGSCRYSPVMDPSTPSKNSRGSLSFEIRSDGRARSPDVVGKTASQSKHFITPG
eukprot:GHVS01033051.1.p1 GENE.GHVS01033051.1~~GHVS01033051.1.p1  ORF type:complete len:585 (-),score=115.15 GHVS01033051.1:155-1909(-)